MVGEFQPGRMKSQDLSFGSVLPVLGLEDKILHELGQVKPFECWVKHGYTFFPTVCPSTVSPNPTWLQ